MVVRFINTGLQLKSVIKMTKILLLFLTINALYNTKQVFKGSISHKFAQIRIPAAISEAAGIIFLT